MTTTDPRQTSEPTDSRPARRGTGTRGTRVIGIATIIAMGWLVVIAARPVAEALPGSVLLWLAIGGVAYTAGTAFYLNRRLPYSHAIWHLFVIAGSTSHVVALALLILTG